MSNKLAKEFTAEMGEGNKVNLKFYYDPEEMTHEEVEALVRDAQKNAAAFYAVQKNQGREFDHKLSYNKEFYHIGQGGNAFSFTVEPK